MDWHRARNRTVLPGRRSYMNQFVTEQLIYVLRLVAAALCGGLIGCERQSKKKTAGTRTHVIIAVASAMMMIISKYGFGDVLNEYVKLDPSRAVSYTHLTLPTIA